MVAKKWKVDLDLCGNELLNGVFQNSHTAPTNPKNGQVYYDLEDSLFKMYQNGSWVSYTTPDDLVSALNDYYDKDEIDAFVTNLEGLISNEATRATGVEGTLSNLTTTSKTNLVSAINELKSDIDSFDPLPDQTGHIGDALFANGTTGEWSPLPIASTTTAGIIRLATSSEISTGTATNVAISAKDLADAVSDIDADLALKADKSTTYTKDEVDAKMVAAFHYKGNVARVGDLPVSGNVTGDVYNVTSTGANYAWDGENWDKLSETIDLTPFLTKTEASSTYETIANVDLIEADITALDGRVDDLEDAISGAVKKEVVIQSSALTSSGGVVTWNISHTLGEDVSITMKEIATGEEVIGSYIFGNNSIVVKMNIAENVPANTFKAIIIG